MDFLDFIRKVHEERKARGLVIKGGKGSGWFAPPKGTHVGRHAKRGESLAGRKGVRGKKARQRSKKQIMARAAAEKLRDTHSALSTNDWRSVKEIAGKAKQPVKEVSGNLALLELEGLAEMKRKGVNIYYKAKAKKRKQPPDMSKWSRAQHTKAINFFVKKPLKELRRRQDLVTSQRKQALQQLKRTKDPVVRARLERGLSNLDVQERHLIAAIDKKEFG